MFHHFSGEQIIPGEVGYDFQDTERDNRFSMNKISEHFFQRSMLAFHYKCK